MAAGVLLLLGGAFAFAPRTNPGQTFVGRFSPDRPVQVRNLTVADGTYFVHYSMRVFVVPTSVDVEVVCGVVDTSGRISNLPGLFRVAPSGSWVELYGQDVFVLPELTLGIRCFPDREVPLQVLVRDVQLEALPVG